MGKMSDGHRDCNLHVVADIGAEATQAISSGPYLLNVQASGRIDDVNKQLCVCRCVPLQQHSFVPEFMDAADGLYLRLILYCCV